MSTMGKIQGKWYCVKTGKFKVCEFRMAPPATGTYTAWTYKFKCSVEQYRSEEKDGEWKPTSKKNAKVFTDPPKGRLNVGKNSGKFRMLSAAYDTEAEAEAKCECPSECSVVYNPENDTPTRSSFQRNH